MLNRIETEEKIKKIISEQLDIDINDVSLDKTFIKDLGADSLDAVELVMVLEEHLNIEIPDEDAEKIINGQAVIDYLIENKIVSE